MRAPWLLVVLGTLASVLGCCAFVTPGLSGRRTIATRGEATAKTAAAPRWAVREVEAKPKLASEWRLSVGHAIDVLRRDVVALYDTEHESDFSIFSDTIQVVDARLPSFQLSGIEGYQRFLAALKWSVGTTCEQSRTEITALSPPVNNEIYVRWRLHLWPKDMLATATGFLAPLSTSTPSPFPGQPFVIEGYSRYEFHPWSAEIVKHTIDITNPPMYVTDLLQQYASVPAWLTPITNGVGVPSVMPQTASVPGIFIPHVVAVSGREQNTQTAVGWLPSLPQSCEDDFECNDGKANFPLQCCELPILGNFCCKPDDFQPTSQNPAFVPLPVPAEEPWEPRG